MRQTYKNRKCMPYVKSNRFHESVKRSLASLYEMTTNIRGFLRLLKWLIILGELMDLF